MSSPKASSAILVSCRQRTSGRRSSSHGSSRGTRCLSELTFQVTIRTPASVEPVELRRMTTTELDYPVPAGSLRAHLATPSGDAPWPGVVVVQDALGLSDDIRAQAGRLADAGYLALAPDLYSAGGRLCVLQTLRASRSGEGRAYDDLEAARQWLAARADCTGKVGIIGFCMGGGFAIICAPRYPFAAS